MRVPVWPRKLNRKLSLALFVMLFILSATHYGIYQYFAEKKANEGEQRLQWDLASNMARNMRPLLEPVVQHEKVREYFRHMVEINPRLDPYLLDEKGKVVEYIPVFRVPQAIFVDLANRAKGADHREWQHHHMTLALKAQAQCRQAITALVELRMPKTVTFTKLANVTNGPQQVNINNGLADGSSRVRARETRIAPNELLEPRHEERLDAGAAGATGLAGPRVEALDPVHRPAER